MSLATNLSDFATRAATEDKSLRTLINGNVADLSALATTAKGNLVLAVNDLQTQVDAIAGGGGAAIDDGSTSTSTVWSSSKTNTEIGNATAALVDAAPGTLDTLNELAAALGDDPAFATTTATALGNRVRTDTAAQGLTGTQQSNARANIDAAPATHTHTAAQISDSTATGRSLMAAADAAAVRTIAGAAATSHTHTAGDITSGTLAVDRLPAATESAIGAVELATTTEAATGTDTTRAITAAGLKAVADTKAALSHTHTASQISDSTATGRSMLTAADAAAARTAIGAGTSTLALGTGAGQAQDASLIGDPAVDYVAVFEAGLV